MVGETGGQIIGLVMVAVVIGVLLTNLNTSVSLGTGTANTTFYLIQTLGWVALTILSVGVIAYVGKWIINIFS